MARPILEIARLSGCLLLIVPAAAAAQTEAPATGFAMWIRASSASIRDLASSAVGAPQFTIGRRGDRLTIGLGLGLSVLRSSHRDTVGGETLQDREDATGFQVGPSAFVDIWRSPDGRARGQLALGIALGRLSVTRTDQFLGPSPGQVSTDITKTTGTLLGIHVALGVEHYLHPHFALGVEGGFQGTFALSMKREGSAETVGLGASGAYGALRATFVF
jgi:hypothetical protein